MLSAVDDVRFSAMHVLGGFAGGALLAGLALAFALRDPVSWEEMRDLEPVPRESLARPGTFFFGPYPCVEFCEGHLAGWIWARERRVRNLDDCSGHGSTSFGEGCSYYLEVWGSIDDGGL